MPGKSLTIEEEVQVKTLFAEGRTYHAIAKQIGRSPHTIKAYLSHEDVQVEVLEKKAELETLYSNLATELIVSVTRQDIDKSSMLQKVTASGICTDKMRLLRNESTSNVAVDLMIRNDQTLDGKIEELKKLLEGA